MADEPDGAAVSRRRLLGAAAVTGGAAALGGAVLTAGDDCTGIDYGPVSVAPGDVAGPVGDERYCSVERSLAERLGVATGDQLRLGAREPEPDAFPDALFTVAAVEERSADAIHAGAGDLEDLGLGAGGAGRASASVPHPCYDTLAEAERHGEFCERRYGGADGDRRLVLLAPHGGYVEPGTGEQAATAARRFGLPAWVCYGANPHGGSYDRWHVSSTELSPASFPELRRVADAGYEAAVAFHGQSFEDARDPFVGIGGRATRLKAAVGAALRAAYAERGVDATVCVHDADTTCEDAGTDPENVVNHVTTSGAGGVQIEQPRSVREAHGRLTARVAVRAVLDALDAPGAEYGPTDDCPC